jgi:hypothetical protein
MNSNGKLKIISGNSNILLAKAISKRVGLHISEKISFG